MKRDPELNPYIPIPVRIARTVIENGARDIKTFDLVFPDQSLREHFDFACGQFAMLSVLGAGESPIGIASSPLDREFVQFTVKRYPHGMVTTALHNLEEGARIGLRGPFGRPFPLSEMEGSNVVIVGGGFAFTTLRSTIRYLLHEDNRSRYQDITVLYGARSPDELLYKTELQAWEKRDDIEVFLTVDKGEQDWSGRVGFVPAVLQDIAPSSKNAFVLLCGPPVMLKFTMVPLLKLGFPPERIITSLERRMSCGVGKCGRCNVGAKYVCKDGPVFSFDQIDELAEQII
ncbi:MAG: FAD/NAD(P)-binding protein [Spirochaetaceae bacterium]|nr:MAG: FAD/NAD(P)-binding protein [Spirochaetaceae bacterium]